MHGRGVYTWQDGRRYEGDYVHDKKHGYGSYTWADGRKYEGEWAFGKQHGKGKYVLPDGVVRVGLWQNGKRISWLEDENENENQQQREGEYGKYYEDNNFTPNQNNTQVTNLSTSPVKNYGYSHVSGDRSDGFALKEQNEIY